MAHGATPFADRAVVAWAASRCLALTTYRGDGSAVVTPVWFVTDAGRLWVWTGADTGKVRRIRRDSRCTVAPCTTAGRPTGHAHAGTARIHTEHGREIRVQDLLRGKYPIQKRALDGYRRLRRLGRRTAASTGAYIEIALAQ